MFALACTLVDEHQEISMVMSFSINYVIYTVQIIHWFVKPSYAYNVDLVARQIAHLITLFSHKISWIFQYITAQSRLTSAYINIVCH